MNTLYHRLVEQVVQKWTYPNGLTLVVDEAPQLMSAAISAWVKTGTRHEDLDSSGLCHFLEHMVFKGGKKKGAMDISKAVDRVGGDFNAFTSREHTCFHFYLPYRELKLGAELLKEVLYRPLFASNELEKERQVILQEISMVKENPEEDSFDQFMERCYGKHPLGRQILGTPESISAVTRKKLFNFFYLHYRPENMLIAVSGRVKFDQVKKTFSELGTKSWPNRKASLRKPQWGVDPPHGTEPGFFWQSANTEQAHVLYGISAPVNSSRERTISNILQQYLGGGMSSVLFDQIREKKGWAYSVYANAVHFLDASLFTLYAGVQSDKSLETLKVFHREMKKIARNGIPPKELARIKDSFLCSFLLSLESSEQRMMVVAQSELFYKNTISFKAYHDLIRSIKGSEIQKLVAKWVKASSPTIYVLGKKPKDKKAVRMIEKSAHQLTKTNVQFLK